MKKAITVISVVFCGIIVFFSFMGERLYYLSKPKVVIDRPVKVDGELLVPRSAIIHDAGGYCIISVDVEKGFSTDILTARKIRLVSLRPYDNGYFGDDYAVIAPGYSNGPIVISSSESIRGGQKVVENANPH